MQTESLHWLMLSERNEDLFIAGFVQTMHTELISSSLQQNSSRRHRRTASEEFLSPAGADRTNTASAQGPTLSIIVVEEHRETK